MSVPAFMIEPLSDHRELLPLLQRWFVAEWPDWYGPSGQGDAVADLEAFAACADRIPLGMVVFQGGVAIGAGALKADSMGSHTHLSPWAGAGFVLPEHRGKGAGAALLAALVAKARALGYPAIYCATSTAESLLLRAGWSVVAVTSQDGKELTIFRSAP